MVNDVDDGRLRLKVGSRYEKLCESRKSEDLSRVVLEIC